MKLKSRSVVSSGRGGKRPGAGRPKRIPPSPALLESFKILTDSQIKAIRKLDQLLDHKNPEIRFKAIKLVLDKTLSDKKVVENKSISIRLNGRELE